MTIQQLEYVVALDRHRHFVKAAESCLITQPTLTMQIKKLEDELGFLLFLRDKHPLIPSEQGKSIITQARKILMEVEQLNDIAGKTKNDITGSFRIGIIPTLAPYFLPLFLKQFSLDFPNTILNIEENQTLHLIEMLKRNELDIAFMSTPLDEPSLKEIALFQEPFIAFASPDHDIHKRKKLDMKDLPNENLWLLSQGHCFRSQTLKLCDLSVSDQNNIKYETGSIESLKNIIKTQGGFTLVPALSVTKTDKEFIRKFETEIPSREISMVVHQGFGRQLLLDTFQDRILKNIPNHFKKNERAVRIKWR